MGRFHPTVRIEPAQNGGGARRSSAVLILQAAERWFAITFGHGRLLLDPARVEQDFGLKAVINSVKPDALRSVDAQSLEEVSLTSSFRIGRAVPMSTFGLDLELELVRALSGHLDNDSFAVKVTGSTALALDAELSFPGIAEKCEEALVRSQADAYKAQFQWIDNVQRVADPERALELEEDLDALLGAGTTESFMLALPRVVPDEQASRFRYSTSETDDDLRWEDYVATVAGGGISVAAMKNQQVTTISADGEDSDHWSVYSCLAVEIEHNAEIYVLTGGEWFRVARSIADRARAFVESLEVGAPTFPPYEAADATEGGYNRRLAASFATGATCLDAKNVRASRADDPIEFADVLVESAPDRPREAPLAEQHVEPSLPAGPPLRGAAPDRRRLRRRGRGEDRRGGANVHEPDLRLHDLPFHGLRNRVRGNHSAGGGDAALPPVLQPALVRARRARAGGPRLRRQARARRYDVVRGARSGGAGRRK